MASKKPDKMDKYAMIFAAGKGSRLGDISQHMPKALVPVAGKPLLFHVLNKLHFEGFNHIVVNTHHHATQIHNWLQKETFSGIKIMISHEKDILAETGGGLKMAYPLFKHAEHILLHNVDILSDIQLRQLYDYHVNSKNIATLAVKDRDTTRQLLFDHKMKLKGWQNSFTGESKIFAHGKLQPIAFSGIHVVSADIVNLMPQNQVFSMTDLYLDICSEHDIGAYLHNDDLWIDVGKPEQLSQAEKLMLKFRKTL
jgi:N-acetyl-alpha-D-muramate 1-phosphate uridylyltransferase